MLSPLFSFGCERSDPRQRQFSPIRKKYLHLASNFYWLFTFEQSALHSSSVLLKTRCLSCGAGIGKNQSEYGASRSHRALTTDVDTTLMFADYVGCNP